MKSWLQLVRPANVLTAVSDVWAGAALAAMFAVSTLAGFPELLCAALSGMLLYTGGIVFNDVFDVELDRAERPERPIPSGKVPKSGAVVLGVAAFALGCLLAFLVNKTAFCLSLGIVLMCFVYNGTAKRHFVLGPVAMGACRGLNLLLGVATLPEALAHWSIALVPIVYIAAVTNISRGEVFGNNRTAMRISAFLYALVALVLLYFTYTSGHFFALAFILSFVLMVAVPLFRALKSLKPTDVRRAVKFGVLALVLMNASWTAIAGFWELALWICAILPMSVYLGGKYAVT